jgi:hypothetical protein
MLHLCLASKPSLLFVQSFKLRLPFEKAVLDRKGVKEAIVEMTKKATTSA